MGGGNEIKVAMYRRTYVSAESHGYYIKENNPSRLQALELRYPRRVDVARNLK